MFSGENFSGKNQEEKEKTVREVNSQGVKIEIASTCFGFFGRFLIFSAFQQKLHFQRLEQFSGFGKTKKYINEIFHF